MSTPEEQIAHKIGTRLQVAEDFGRTCERQSEGQDAGTPRQRRVHRGRRSSALPSRAAKVWETTATCAVVTVACSLGEDTETQQGFQKPKQACADSRGIVMGTGKARGPLKLRQMRAEGRDHGLIQTLPWRPFMQPVATPTSAVCSSGGTGLRK